MATMQEADEITRGTLGDGDKESEDESGGFYSEDEIDYYKEQHRKKAKQQINHLGDNTTLLVADSVKKIKGLNK